MDKRGNEKSQRDLKSYFNRGSSATNPSTRESGNVEVEVGESVGAGQVEERQEQLQLGYVQVEERYHNNAFHACRALYIANKLNSSATYPLLELFFKNQDKFSNSVTSSLSSTAITSEMSKMAAQAVGNSVPEFQSGFSDVRTDLAARVSFQYGCTRGVAGAPFFFVNGFLQPGGGSPIDYSTWVSILDPLVAHHGERFEMFTSM